MICKKCGNEVPDDNNFCICCGYNISEDPEGLFDNENSNLEQENKSLLNETNEFKALNAILLGISIVIAIISLFNFGMTVRVLTLSLSFVLMIVSIALYKKKKSKYDFFTFTLNVVFLLANIGFIIFIMSLK